MNKKVVRKPKKVLSPEELAEKRLFDTLKEKGLA